MGVLKRLGKVLDGKKNDGVDSSKDMYFRRQVNGKVKQNGNEQSLQGDRLREGGKGHLLSGKRASVHTTAQTSGTSKGL